jgi:hypothetical protein
MRRRRASDANEDGLFFSRAKIFLIALLVDVGSGQERSRGKPAPRRRAQRPRVHEPGLATVDRSEFTTLRVPPPATKPAATVPTELPPAPGGAICTFLIFIFSPT